MSDFSIQNLSADIRAAIAELKSRPEIENVGIGHPRGRRHCLDLWLGACGYSEMMEIERRFGGKVTAFAFNLGEDEIGAVLLGEDTEVKAGAKARLSAKFWKCRLGRSWLAAWLTR